MGEQLSFYSSGESLFVPADAVRAMRDSRYHNTAYALSELIDNSIDARAKHIDILTFEERSIANVNRTWRLAEIAVLDDGSGMSRETLIQSLQFGGRKAAGIRQIGKYGMGLPTASVSKCRRVDVWTWDNGIENLWHCYIDVDAIEENAINAVPMPDQMPLPSVYLDRSFDGTLNQSHGTLVIWRDLDKVSEKSETIFDHIEREIGKIHRYFINDGDVIIRAASFREAQVVAEHEKIIRANDPLYLMPNTSTPDPWSISPMFEPYGIPKTYKEIVNGKEQNIEVHYSIVRKEALNTPGYANAGNSPHGRHARPNLGVSVVRERREILLEDNFVRAGGASTNPENRWWGCQVSFGHDADDLFGVDHNKQMAAHFTQAAKEVMNDDRHDNEILNDTGYSGSLMHRIALDIRNTTRAMRRDVERMMGQRKMLPNGQSIGRVSNQAAAIAKQATQEAIQQKKEPSTATDQARLELSVEQREDMLAQTYIAEGLEEADARMLAKQLVENDEWYNFESDQLDGYQMFRIRNRAGVLRVILNMDHPIHDFIRMFEDQAKAELSDPVRRAGLGLILLLMAWARMEDQIEIDDDRRQIQSIAQQWGKHVDEFIRQLTD